MTILCYNGYQGSVTYESGTLVIQVLHIDDLITTECGDASEAENAFRELVDDYIATCARIALDWEDTREVRMDSTMLMGKGYDWEGWEHRREETDTPLGRFAVWQTGKTWNLYGGHDGYFKQGIESNEAAKAEVARLVAAAAAATKEPIMGEWRDIASAPRDETILLGRFGKPTVVGYHTTPERYDDYGWRHTGSNCWLAWKPTHWMPLPAHPAACHRCDGKGLAPDYTKPIPSLQTPRTCPVCAGTGYARETASVQGWDCPRCRGTGNEPRP